MSIVSSIINAFKPQPKPAPSLTPAPSKPPLIPGINYNPSTGVYTNPQGQKQSIAPTKSPFMPSPQPQSRPSYTPTGSSSGGGSASPVSSSQTPFLSQNLVSPSAKLQQSKLANFLGNLLQAPNKVISGALLATEQLTDILIGREKWNLDTVRYGLSGTNLNVYTPRVYPKILAHTNFLNLLNGFPTQKYNTTNIPAATNTSNASIKNSPKPIILSPSDLNLKNLLNEQRFTVGEFTAGQVVRTGVDIGSWILAGDIRFGSLIASDVGKLVSGQGITKGEALFDVGALLLSNVGKIYNYGEDVVRTRGLSELKLASADAIPFYRNSEAVFMKRYEGVKITELSSVINWAQGYKKGQFIRREYRIIAPEVQRYFETGGKVGTPFPYDKPSTHLEWFKEKNMQEFGLPRRSELPIDVKGKAYGLSATGKAWTATKIGEAGQYYSGKGASIAFLRLQEKYAKSLGDITTGSSPTVYAGYFDKVIENKALKEIKIPNPYEPAGKPIKEYLFSKPTEEGVLNIPLMKREVEGVVFGERIPIAKREWFRLGGRRVVIEEQAFTKGISKPKIKMLESRGFARTTESSISTYPKLASKEEYGSSLISIAGEYSMSRYNVYSEVPLSRVSSVVPLSRVSSVSSLSPRPYSKSLEPSYPEQSYPKRSYSYQTRSPMLESPLRNSSVLREPRFYQRKKIKESLLNPYESRIISSKETLKLKEDRAIMPDFTARELNLSEKISRRQIPKLLGKYSEGLGIRRMLEVIP